jgi:Ran GTPase-activating protein (RanGAP) involved in mRNA processing and transport
VYKSRGETPEEDIALNGICEINLSYNRLDTLFIKDLEYFLRNDRWLKSLNLRGNVIDDVGLQILNEILDVNQAILSLDVRDNPGTKTKLSKSIYGKLVRNMNNLKE